MIAKQLLLLSIINIYGPLYSKRFHCTGTELQWYEIMLDKGHYRMWNLIYWFFFRCSFCRSMQCCLFLCSNDWITCFVMIISGRSSVWLFVLVVKIENINLIGAWLMSCHVLYCNCNWLLIVLALISAHLKCICSSVPFCIEYFGFFGSSFFLFVVFLLCMSVN